MRIYLSTVTKSRTIVEKSKFSSCGPKSGREALHETNCSWSARFQTTKKNMNYSIKNQLRLKQSRGNTLRRERLRKDDAAPNKLSHAFFLDRDLRGQFFRNNRRPRGQQTTPVAHSNRNSLKPRQYWSQKAIDSRRSASKTQCQQFKFLNVARETNFGARSRTQLSMSGRPIGITAVVCGNWLKSVTAKNISMNLGSLVNHVHGEKTLPQIFLIFA